MQRYAGAAQLVQAREQHRASGVGYHELEAVVRGPVNGHGGHGARERVLGDQLPVADDEHAAQRVAQREPG